MPYTDTGLPFASGSHESYMAAQRVARTRATKTQRYLQLLFARGPLTDHEAAALMPAPLSSINSIRNGAMHSGLVERGSECRVSAYGSPCRTWRLSDAGVAAVRNFAV